MNHCISTLLAIPAFALAGIVVSAQSLAQNAYITNAGTVTGEIDTVSVINTAIDKVIATIPIGPDFTPYAVAVTSDGSRVYVTDLNAQSVSVIDGTTNMVTATITVGPEPRGVAVGPDGNRVYAANAGPPPAASQ
jgi:YVTN family beta-propeller protein